MFVEQINMSIKIISLLPKRARSVSCFVFSMILLLNTAGISFIGSIVHGSFMGTSQLSANNSDSLCTDVNGDGVVNIFDLAIVGAAYGSYPGHSRWNANADLNDDDTVNLFDVILVVGDFGRIFYSTLRMKSYTSAGVLDAQDLAEYFDMCQASYGDGEKIQAVHKIRPDFKALLYRNFRAVYTYADEWDVFVAKGWVLRDVNGDYVYSTEYGSSYRLVDIGNPDYQVWVANWVKEYLDLYGFNGVFADNSLSASASELFWGVSARPINPRTASHWTDQEIRQAQIALHNKVKQAIGSRLLICNGIYYGSWFYEQYEGFVDVLQGSLMDGYMSEGIWYTYDRHWFSESEWLDSLNFLIWTQDHFLKERDSSAFVPVCKLVGAEGDPYPLPSGCTKQQLFTYAFASTLLGVKTEKNYVGFSAGTDFIREIAHPLFNIDVGKPLNPYYMVEGTHVYARDYTRIKVLVNPTDQPYTVILDKDYKTLDGQIVSSVSVQPHNGVILKNPYNLLLNPSVEEDIDDDHMPDHWETWNYDDITVSFEWSTHQPHSDLRSVFVSIESNTSAPEWHSTGLRQFFDPSILRPGQSYKFRCWYKSNVTIHLVAIFWDSSYNCDEVKMQIPTNYGNWKQTEWLTFSIPESTHHLAVGATLLNEDIASCCQGWTYLDNFELYETSST